MRLNLLYKKSRKKCTVNSECSLPDRAEKQIINEKIKEADQIEEVDDSGFYAGRTVVPLAHNLAFFCFLSTYIFSNFPQVVQSPRWV